MKESKKSTILTSEEVERRLNNVIAKHIPTSKSDIWYPHLLEFLKSSIESFQLTKDKQLKLARNYRDKSDPDIEYCEKLTKELSSGRGNYFKEYFDIDEDDLESLSNSLKDLLPVKRKTRVSPVYYFKNKYLLLIYIMLNGAYNLKRARQIDFIHDFLSEFEIDDYRKDSPILIEQKQRIGKWLDEYD